MSSRVKRALTQWSLTILLSLLLTAAAAELLLRTAFQAEFFLDPKFEPFWIEHNRSLEKGDTQGRGRDTIYDPQLGWRMKPLYEAEGVLHDEYGFRTVPEESAQTTRSFLFVGDSFTYGLGVSHTETFAARIGRKYNVRAINAGVNAYGADQSLLMLEKEGPGLSPSYVVLGYFVDDFFRNAMAIRDRPKPSFQAGENRADYELAGVPVEQRSTFLRKHDERSHGGLQIANLAGWAKKRILRNLGYESSVDYPEHARLNHYILKRYKQTADKLGSNLIVLVFGYCKRDVPDYEYAESQIMAACGDLGLNCINTANAMRTHKNYDEMYGNNCHFSPEGHEYVTELVSARIR